MTLAEKWQVGRVHLPVKTGQALQGCDANCGVLERQGSGRGAIVLFRRYWEQGVLCGHVIHVLRLVEPGLRRGAIMATWSERFLHAIQNPAAAIIGTESGGFGEAGSRALHQNTKEGASRRRSEHHPAWWVWESAIIDTRQWVPPTRSSTADDDEWHGYARANWNSFGKFSLVPCLRKELLIFRPPISTSLVLAPFNDTIQDFVYAFRFYVFSFPSANNMTTRLISSTSCGHRMSMQKLAIEQRNLNSIVQTKPNIS